MSLKVHIKKDFGSFKLNVDFENENETLALLGKSGSGKSITLKCIAGLEKPDEGYIELNGRVLFDSSKKINLSPQKRNVGYLFQNYALFPNMNVVQNIKCGLNKFKGNKEEKTKKINELIALFHLEGLEKHKPHQLSGGQQQRVALARILATDPELLLLDEPFSALDDHLRTGLQLEMKSLINKYKGEVILVTHNRDEAYILSDRTVVLSNGNSVVSKGTKELFENPETLEAAIITGCKNYAPCEKASNTSVFVPDWGITLETEKIVPMGVKYVGIRAHSFEVSRSKSSNRIEIVDIVEQPFENQIRFRFSKQKVSANTICWFVDKENKTALSAKRVSVNPEDILLLK